MPVPLGVAVFGCGGVSNGHFSAYATNPKARLVAAIDVRPELAQAVVATSDLIDPAGATEDTGIVTLRFANGCVGEATVSYVLKDPRLASGWDVMPIEIYGRDGSIRMDWDDTITVTSRTIGGEAGAGIFQVHPTPPVGAPRLSAEGMAGAIDHLLDCLIEGKQPLTHGEDARASLELVEAAYRSIAEERPVQLPLTLEQADDRQTIGASTGGRA